MSRFAYDVICIGGGPGGGAAAQQVRLRGGRACIVEDRFLGGTCLNVGCMPTKALLASGHRAWEMTHADDLAIPPVEPDIDGQAVMRRVADIVDDLRTAMRDKLSGMDRVDVIRGRGYIRDAHTVAVDTPDGEKTLTARCLVIATGSQPTRPGFLPWDSGRVWTSDHATNADHLPESILVLGGGPLGCEFATAYAELGVRVCMVEMMDRLLHQLPDRAGEVVQKSLTARGVDVHLGQEVTGASFDGESLTVECGSGCSFHGSHALVAVGRHSCPGELGLKEIGVMCEDDTIPVDDRCRTSVEGVYAAGDVAELRNHSHLAERMGIVAGDQIMGVDTRDDRTVVPVGVYSHPEVAHVGLGPDEAREQHGREAVDVLHKDYADAGTAWLYAERAGGLELVVGRDDGAILGALWIGPQAVDMIHELALAMRQGVTLAEIYGTIHAHPSFQETLHALAETWMDQRAGKDSK
ncbi:MAG: dihydrolipoyl dehydrogenase family protein [Phycisphaerae bacterium]